MKNQGDDHHLGKTVFFFFYQVLKLIVAKVNTLIFNIFFRKNYSLFQITAALSGLDLASSYPILTFKSFFVKTIHSSDKLQLN